DGAHNGASAESLAAALSAFAAGRPIHLVIGINRDKDARAVLRPLLPLAESVSATQTVDNPRALPAVDLGRVCRQFGVTAHVESDPGNALKAAAADSGGGVVCVTGSLMLVGQARTSLGLPAAERLWTG